MPQDTFTMEDRLGTQSGTRVLTLQGPLTLNAVFGFQATVRADKSPTLIMDLTNTPYVDSAGIGALVGAYVTHQKEGRNLALVGVCERVRNAFRVTRVDEFFRYFDSVEAAEQASAA
jgi:anti-sigma B factor antagonist